jgi:hypothetical protein
VKTHAQKVKINVQSKKKLGMEPHSVKVTYFASMVVQMGQQIHVDNIHANGLLWCSYCTLE